jgi:CRISPR-associated protein Cmr6
MSSANIGWLFYKDYFADINYQNLDDKKNKEDIKKKVENIISQTPNIEDLNDEDMLGNIHFSAITTYPGLILGSGNTHELPSIEGQAILGFHFDYTSGLPVISGSSIKGVLRSAFKHKEYILELVKNETLNVKKLEDEIFENNDIFFDATIIKADSFRKILGDDFLAPHSEDGLKNPIPLRFIKVLPNVSFRFDFELSDGILTKGEKSKLFQNILSDLGLGAKTNVGYGKFDNFKSESEKQNEKFDEILNSDNIQIIRNFIQANQTHTKLKQLEEKIVSLEKAQIENKFAKINEEAQKAFNGAIGQKDKNKKKQYLLSWIKKWEDEKNNQKSSYILDLIVKAKQEI